MWGERKLGEPGVECWKSWIGSNQIGGQLYRDFDLSILLKWSKIPILNPTAQKDYVSSFQCCFCFSLFSPSPLFFFFFFLVVVFVLVAWGVVGFGGHCRNVGALLDWSKGAEMFIPTPTCLDSFAHCIFCFFLLLFSSSFRLLRKAVIFFNKNKIFEVCRGSKIWCQNVVAYLHTPYKRKNWVSNWSPWFSLHQFVTPSVPRFTGIRLLA